MMVTSVVMVISGSDDGAIWLDLCVLKSDLVVRSRPLCDVDLYWMKGILVAAVEFRLKYTLELLGAEVQFL
jgi:hypothetical protein